MVIPFDIKCADATPYRLSPSVANVANQIENVSQVKVRKSQQREEPSVDEDLGIAFRHAQNAGFSGAGGKDLANFYKYRQKFENTYFLPVPRECKRWRHMLWFSADKRSEFRAYNRSIRQRQSIRFTCSFNVDATGTSSTAPPTRPIIWA